AKQIPSSLIPVNPPHHFSSSRAPIKSSRRRSREAMETEGLALICAGLGIVEEDDDGNRIGYSKGEQCLENLKDLVRFLRRDDPQTRQVFKRVCKWNIVSKDLIPMFQYCQDDRDLVLNAVKVLVFLTMPVDQSSNDVAIQLEYLWKLKSAITSSETVAVIVSLLEGPLENLECESLTEDDWKLIQLVLTLFRNILAIQDMSSMGGSACQFVSLRDGFLELLFNENVMDLLLVLTQHVCGSRGYLRHDNLLLLEVFHYIFMGQDPDLIAKARFKDSKVSSAAYVDNLKSIMEVEKQKLKQCRAQNVARHSQFSGTFSRITMDGSKTVCKVNPGAASNSLIKPHAVQRGASKKIVWDHDKFPVTKDKILELLHDFMKQFLSGSYNASSSDIPVLIKSIREDIEKEQIAVQKSDIIVFFQVVQFVTSFQYYTLLNSKETAKDSAQASNDHGDSTVFTGDVCGPIAESMKESMFLMVISTWRDAFEALKQTHEYKLLSAAGSVMKIMIRILDLVLKVLPENSKEPQTARILLYKLFYDQTDQGMTQFLLNLVKSFNTHKQSKSDLADLVETVHVIVRLMGILQTRGTMRVSKGSRKVRKKKPSKDQKGAGDLPSGGEATAQDKNESLPDSSNVEKASQENETSNQQESIDIDIPIPADKPEIPPEMGNPDSENRNDHIDDELSSCSEDDSDDDQPVSNYEVDFNVSTFMRSFANHSIISNLCWLLTFYKSNSVGTNHYIITMLRRITDDLDLAPMLYQVSLLTTFYSILNEQKESKCEEYENIVEFLTTLVRRMLRKMKNQPLLFLEILFWKSRTECQYINTDYLVHELGSLRKKTKAFNDSGEDGDVGSSGWAPRNIADALGDDEADVVITHDVENQGMQENSDELQNENASTSGSSFSRKSGKHERVPKKKRLVLTEEMEIKIKDLYEEFKDDERCCHRIAESLDPMGGISPTQVFNKLKQLGLKASLRKRIRNVRRAPDSDDQGEKNAEEAESMRSKQPTGTRKRAPAIGKDQEDKLRDLYEQFKGEKKCSHMIANALAPEGTFTAAQVSRKLKQLGLVAPRKKRSQADVDADHESDDETLLSFKERRIRDARERKRSKKSTTEEATAAGETADNGEDDGSSGGGASPANDDEQMMADDVEADDDDDSPADEDGGNELEDDDVDEVSPAGGDDGEQQMLEDELEDDDVDVSRDDEVEGGDVEGSVQQMRRKSRMVIDDDDDDE
ncbi:Topoisomerase 1-associated factor 1, partial [Linum perenne]